MISIIITSLTPKPPILETIKSVPFFHERIISTRSGLAAARNIGAKFSHGHLLIFFDGDLKINRKIWSKLEYLKEGSFIMAYEGYAHGGTPQPVTRVLAIHKKDFEKIKFDNRFKYRCEDRDFFLSAIRAGLKPIFLKPKGYYEHIEHSIRALKNSYVLHRSISDTARCMVKHGAYTRNYKGFTKWFFPFMFKKSYTNFGLKPVIRKTYAALERNMFVLFYLIKGV
jgi:glycosyltransferase involved in cell wall biosynthesis